MNNNIISYNKQNLTQYSSDLIKKGLDLSFKISEESQQLDESLISIEKKQSNKKIWKPLYTLNPHLKKIKYIKLNGDGSRVILVDGWGTGIIWDIVNNQLINTFDSGYLEAPENDEIEILHYLYESYQVYGGNYKIYVNEDNHNFITVNDEEIRFFELETGQLIEKISIKDKNIEHINLAQNIIVTTNKSPFSDCLVEIWDINTCALIHYLNPYNTSMDGIDNSLYQNYIDVSLDGKLLAISGHLHLQYTDNLEEEKGNDEYGFMEKAIIVGNWNNGQLLHKFNKIMYKWTVDCSLRSFDIFTIKITHDNQYLVSVDNFVDDEDTYIVKIWNLQTGKLSFILPEPLGKEIVEITKNNQLITCTSDNQTVKIWDINTGTLLFNLQEHSEKINHCLLNPNHDILVSSDIKGTINIWNLTTGELIQKIREYSSVIHDIEFSQDGKIMLTRDKEKIMIWKLSNEQEEFKEKNLELDKNNLIQNLLALADDRYISGHYTGVIESCTKVLSFELNNKEAYNKRSSAYSAIGEVEKALEDLQKLQWLT